MIPLFTRIAVVLLVTVLTAGCGGSELTPDESLDVAEARQSIALTILNGSGYERTLEGVDDLIRICRAKPDAEYDTTDGTLTMRQVLEDEAARLDRYRGELSDRLARVAAAGCE